MLPHDPGNPRVIPHARGTELTLTRAVTQPPSLLPPGFSFPGVTVPCCGTCLLTLAPPFTAQHDVATRVAAVAPAPHVRSRVRKERRGPPIGRPREHCALLRVLWAATAVPAVRLDSRSAAYARRARRLSLACYRQAGLTVEPWGTGAPARWLAERVGRHGSSDGSARACGVGDGPCLVATRRTSERPQDHEYRQDSTDAPAMAGPSIS